MHTRDVRSSDGSGGPLSGKVAVVTSASSGIGAAIAVRLAVAGAKVALAAWTRWNLRRLVDTVEETFGPIDILANNGALASFLRRREPREVVELTYGVLNGVTAVLPKLLTRKSGHIVNISSTAGRRVFAGLGVYSASKMFVEAVSQAPRLENAGSGLRVTSIQPGNVTTELVNNGYSAPGFDKEGTKLYGGTSRYEVLKAEDVANAVLYAVTQPPNVAVNEVLVQPRDEPH